MINQVLDHSGKEIAIEAFHPGEFLKEELEARSANLESVCALLNISRVHLWKIFKGEKDITANLAVNLEHILGISAEYWFGMQNDWDLQRARKLFPKPFVKSPLTTKLEQKGYISG